MSAPQAKKMWRRDVAIMSSKPECIGVKYDAEFHQHHACCDAICMCKQDCGRKMGLVNDMMENIMTGNDLAVLNTCYKCVDGAACASCVNKAANARSYVETMPTSGSTASRRTSPLPG
jgi:hypothetical protein